MDQRIHALHSDVFSKIDCLQCANCCKTTGPLFTLADITRISKKLGLSASKFQDQYLQMDEDGDMVLQQTPCAFLAPNNECSIYEFRPKACRSYPHTDMENQSKIFDLTMRNAEICPAVFDILEQL